MHRDTDVVTDRVELEVQRDAGRHGPLAGEQITAEDVKFSFMRYRGATHDMMKARVSAIDVIDPKHIRFQLKEPWPDFLTFYGSATGAGWIVPKKYVEGR